MRADVVLVWACLLLRVERGWAQPTPPAVSSGSFASTSQLVSDAKLAAWLDALGARKVVDLTPAGPDGDDGRLARLLGQIEAATTPAQRLALLRHKSPVVRGYAARYWLTAARDALDAALPLLDDESEISTRKDCRLQAVLMCDFVFRRVTALQEVASAPIPMSIQSRLVTVAQRAEHRCQLASLRALAALRHESVAELAVPLLDRAELSQQITGLALLSRVPRAHHAARVRALAASRQPTLRAQAAMALSAWPEPESEALLRSLMEHDPSPAVRGQAAHSYAQQPTRDLPWLLAFRKAAKRSEQRQVELGLAYDARPDSLASLRSLLVPNVLVSSDFFFDTQGSGFAGKEVGPRFVEFLHDLRKEKISTELAKQIDRWLADRKAQMPEPRASLAALDRALGSR